MKTQKTKKLTECLNIDETRGEFLKRKISEIYTKNIKNKTIVDSIHEARQFAQNASEDIFVCYTIGYITGAWKNDECDNTKKSLIEIFGDPKKK